MVDGVRSSEERGHKVAVSLPFTEDFSIHSPEHQITGLAESGRFGGKSRVPLSSVTIKSAAISTSVICYHCKTTTPSMLLTMVISNETRAAIIALHKNGLTGKSIAATKIAPQSTIYRIIKNFKERASIVVKKAPGRPRKTSKRQDRILKLFQLRDRTTSSAELAQEWQQAGVSASARTVRRRLFEQGLVSRRAAKKPLLSRKNIRDRLIFCKRYREWTAKDWGKVIFSDESPFRLFGTSGKQLIRRRRGEHYHQSCLMPTVKHPETIHVWGCFSAKGIGSLTVLPKNTAMNKEWYQNVLQEQLFPTVQEQFGAQQCLFQHDGAPCHKAKVLTKWLMEQNIEILGPWPGNSPDLNRIENLWSIIKRRVNKQKPTNSGKMQALIMQEWTAISQDLVQKLIESMPGRIAEVLKKKGYLTRLLQNHTVSACDGEHLTLQCPRHSTISIQSAIYGRPSHLPPMCATLSQETMHSPHHKCLAQTALQKVLDECQNLRSCLLLVNSRVFGIDPCPGITKYLLVSYKCKPTEYKSTSVCENRELKLHCKEPKLLNIYSAIYGRFADEKNPCTTDLDKGTPYDCISYSALDVLAQRCYGKQRCRMVVHDKHFGSPCLPGVVKYLTVNYSCVPKIILKEVDPKVSYVMPPTKLNDGKYGVFKDSSKGPVSEVLYLCQVSPCNLGIDKSPRDRYKHPSVVMDVPS
ncbi:unnamed protein product [Ranitomeya imitator]|uniref:SUEL-type lectin domain-containing protein n=1 Tax=Ranitomeya imitator TaxID=111125 RepID=A0ABN9KU67_9NEOB|nr:unnamed protein product [Ranitomeya imitator]